MILNGGEFDGRRYLKPETVELMHTNVLEPGVNVTLYSPDTTGLGFGMDFAIVAGSGRGEDLARRRRASTGAARSAPGSGSIRSTT